jgi:predicted AAA+ superfamily ATPase
VIPRSAHERRVVELLRTNPVVALLGARQVGKSTLARQVARRFPEAHHFDLESPADLRRLEEPQRTLHGLRGLVVLDEIQRRPELFPVLRVLADAPRAPRFLVLGSAVPALLRQSSETLAGRIAFHALAGFSLNEVGATRLKRLWVRGGFPRSFTARTEGQSRQWRADFVTTFLERDLPQLGVRTAAATLRRFWSMLAHVHGNTLNWSELGRSLGVADTTIRSYLEVLEGSFMVRLLPPWFENLSKRQVKSPKVFVTDTGLLHHLLGIGDAPELERHTRVGASWEGFCIEQVVHHLGARPEQCFHWRTQAGAELDLLVVTGGRRLGFEAKLTRAPGVTPSMRAALKDLRLDRLDVLYDGDETYQLTERIRAVPLRKLTTDVPSLV